EAANGLGRSQRIGKADDGLPCSEERGFAWRRPHLQQDVSRPENVGALDDRRSLRPIRVVGEAGRNAGARLDGYLETGFDEGWNCRGNERDAGFTGPGFFRNADSHVRKSLADLPPIRTLRTIAEGQVSGSSTTRRSP